MAMTGMGFLPTWTDPQWLGRRRQWRENQYGEVVCEEFDCFCHFLRVIFGDIQGIASVVLWDRAKVPDLHSTLGKVDPLT